jgi:hypothetical protein
MDFRPGSKTHASADEVSRFGTGEGTSPAQPGRSPDCIGVPQRRKARRSDQGCKATLTSRLSVAGCSRDTSLRGRGTDQRPLTASAPPTACTTRLALVTAHRGGGAAGCTAARQLRDAEDPLAFRCLMTPPRWSERVTDAPEAGLPRRPAGPARGDLGRRGSPTDAAWIAQEQNNPRQVWELGRRAEVLADSPRRRRGSGRDLDRINRAPEECSWPCGRRSPEQPRNHPEPRALNEVRG